MIFGMVGIPFMLSVLADVGGLMAEGIEYTWLSNRDRLRLLAEKLNIIKPRKVSGVRGPLEPLGKSKNQSFYLNTLDPRSVRRRRRRRGACWSPGQ